MVKPLGVGKRLWVRKIGTRQEIKHMEISELGKRLEGTIAALKVSKHGTTFYIPLSSGYTLSFDELMKFAKALGTTKFHLDTEIELGYRWSDITVDPDVVLKEIVVEEKDIDSGLGE